MVRDSASYVLIVEDDYDIREVLSEVLADEGFTVAGAANGQEAIELIRARAEKPFVILLDLMMPVMSGSQFAVELRKDPAFAQTPIVVVSADGNLPQKAQAISAEAFLRKPVEIDALVDLVARYAPA